MKPYWPSVILSLLKTKNRDFGHCACWEEKEGLSSISNSVIVGLGTNAWDTSRALKCKKVYLMLKKWVLLHVLITFVMFLNIKHPVCKLQLCVSHQTAFVILDITTEPQDSTQNTTITNHKITNESCMSINDIFWAPKYLCTTITTH